MKTVSLKSKTDTAGVLHLDILAEKPNADYEVLVVLQPSSGVGGGWPPGFIEQTAGSIQDESFMRQEQEAPSPSVELPPVRAGADLRGSELIGIWADRADIDDSRDFARQLRKQASHRRGDLDAPGH